jgi:hypothetical protein
LLRGRARVREEIREAEKPIGRLRDRKGGAEEARGDRCLVRLPRLLGLLRLG